MTDNDDTNPIPMAATDALCRHIVCLMWTDEPRGPARPMAVEESGGLESFAVSAFIVSIRGFWHLVTAGHIFKDLDSRLRAGRRILRSWLVDGMASVERFPPIPFALGETRQWYIDRAGMDYALIPLRPGYVHPLLAGGVRALAEPSWTGLPDHADAYFLLGFPKQARSVSVTPTDSGSRVDLSIATPILPIFPVEEPPDALRSEAERFYARVPIGTGEIDGHHISLTDLDGMSGGPIFALKHLDGRSQYWIVAVQSGWAPRSRVLAACPIEPLVKAVGECFDKHQGETQEREVE